MEEGLPPHEVLALQWLFLEQGLDALQRQCAVYANSSQVREHSTLLQIVDCPSLPLDKSILELTVRVFPTLWRLPPRHQVQSVFRFTLQVDPAKLCDHSGKRCTIRTVVCRVA